MMTHPFEVKASASAQAPDELMITWGNAPQGSVASIYLPAVSSADVIALADTMYVRHRLTASDPHTVDCPAGGVTFVPVPAGQGRYAGLLSVDLPAKTRPGEVFTLAVRQLTQVTVPAAPESFSWRQVCGAFQYTLTIEDAAELLYPEERLLAWLKWRIGVMPSASRWFPVLKRYGELTDVRVRSFGGDPGAIPASQSGAVPAKLHPPTAPPSPGRGR
jgi:hypothetical protein